MTKQRYLAIDITTLTKWNRSPVGIIRTQLEFVRYTLLNDDTALYFKFNDKKDDIKEVSKEIVQEVVSNLLNSNTKKRDQKINPNKKAKILKKGLFVKILDTYRYEGTKGVLIKVCKKICPAKIKNIAKKIYIKFSNTKIVATNSIVDSIQSHIFSPEIHQASYIEPTFLSKRAIVVSMGLDWDYSNYPLLFWLKKRIGFEFVSAFYDSIPVTHPQYVQSHYFSQMFFSYLYYLIHISNRIFCISDYSKNQLEEILKQHYIKEKKILKTIHLGDSISDKPKEELSNKKRHKHRYLLYVSTIESRKNHKLLLDVWQKLSREKYKNLPDLILVGMMGWGIDDLKKIYDEDKDLQKVVHFYSDVDDEELANLYTNAEFTLFPSFVEGWGLGAVESMLYGKPCIISDCPALKEATQNLMPSLNPDDTEAWIKMIKLLLENTEKLEELKLSIKNSFKPRSWEKFSEDFISFARSSI